MLKYELVEVKVSNKTISYYRNILNKELYVGDIIEVSSIDLQDGSSLIVTGICDFCGDERKLSKKNYNTQTDFSNQKFTCSKKCSLLKSQETNKEKYGVKNTFQSEEIKNKIRNTLKKRFGVSNPQKSEDIREKTKKTNLSRFGYYYPSMSDNIKSKVKETNLSRFGVNYPAQSNSILNKMKITCNDKYGVDNYSKTSDFKENLKKKSFYKMLMKLKSHGILSNSENGKYSIICDSCGCEFEILYTLMYKRISNGDSICTNCNPKNQNLEENNLYEFIKSNYNGEIIRNDRNLISKELDIFLPDLNIAFEFNGLYWHCELYKEKQYHYKKTKECLDKNVQLIHIWEDDWMNKRKIIEYEKK
jgi:hypothetical protein